MSFPSPASGASVSGGNLPLYHFSFAPVQTSRCSFPLPYALRKQMEQLFSADFGEVIVHIGPEAAQLGAAAFAHGSHLHFAPEFFAPERPDGLRLLGHELAHVLQQRHGLVPVQPGTCRIVHDAALEAEAELAGACCALGFPVTLAGDDSTRPLQAQSVIQCSSPPPFPLGDLARLPAFGGRLLALLPTTDQKSLLFVDKTTRNAVFERLIMTGHGLQHHCMQQFKTNLDCVQLLTDFRDNTAKGRVINKVSIKIKSLMDPKKLKVFPAANITAEMVLRVRCIGVSPITLMLMNDPAKCDSYAFKTRAVFDSVARRVIHLFYSYIEKHGKRGGTITYSSPGSPTPFQVVAEYWPKQGFSFIIPLNRLLPGGVGCMGYYADQKFLDIAATVRELAPCAYQRNVKGSPKFSQDGAAMLFSLLLAELTIKEDPVVDGKLKVVIGEDGPNGEYYLKSLYPMPQPQNEKKE